MKPYRYGYVSREPQKRLTPKSAFLRKLERMQRAATINEVFAAPLAQPRLKLVRK